jgi:hypothetical protein
VVWCACRRRGWRRTPRSAWVRGNRAARTGIDVCRRAAKIGHGIARRDSDRGPAKPQEWRTSSPSSCHQRAARNPSPDTGIRHRRRLKGPNGVIARARAVAARAERGADRMRRGWDALDRARLRRRAGAVAMPSLRIARTAGLGRFMRGGWPARAGPPSTTVGLAQGAQKCFTRRRPRALTSAGGKQAPGLKLGDRHLQTRKRGW